MHIINPNAHQSHRISNIHQQTPKTPNEGYIRDTKKSTKQLKKRDHNPKNTNSNEELTEDIWTACNDTAC